MKRGFTIIEVLVMISVVAILTTIGIISYGNWRQKSLRDAITADLKSAAQAMEQYRNFHNTYPTLPAGASIPNYNGGPVHVYIQGADGKEFCIEATRGSQKMHITSKSSDVSDGGCSWQPSSCENANRLL